MPLKDKKASRAYHRTKYAKDPEKYIDYSRQYRKTPKGIRINKLSRWKRTMGIIIPDEDALYERFESAVNCELCGKEFTCPKNKCLDHHHASGYARNVCCTKCNNKLGGVDHRQHSVLLELHRYFLRQ